MLVGGAVPAAAAEDPGDGSSSVAAQDLEVADDPLTVVADPLIDANLDVVETAASVNDSRSLSLTDDALTVGGTCIVGLTALGTADTDSTSGPQGTSSTSRGDGDLPVAVTELAHASVPTEPGEPPTAGAAVAVATAPDGDARSSGTVTRTGADSDTETGDSDLGVDAAVHSEEVVGSGDEPDPGDADAPVVPSLTPPPSGDLVPTG